MRQRGVNKMNKLHVVTGTTASGKTKFSVEKALETGAEIVSCDSRQVYASLDIITGKDFDTKNFSKVSTLGDFSIGYYTLNNGVKVWLYDILEPSMAFSSFDYRRCAIKTIKEIFSRGKSVIICGGTYFYLKHLLYGYTTESIVPNWKLRNELGEQSVSQLQKLLKNKSTDIFNSLNESDINNPQRLIRKIEIAEAGIQKIDENKMDLSFFKQELGQPQLKIEFTAIKPKNMESLTERIQKRVADRINQGAVEEVKSVLSKYGEAAPGLKTIGYAQLTMYINGTISLERAVEEWATKERQYAKRQLTFMTKDPNLIWQLIV